MGQRRLRKEHGARAPRAVAGPLGSTYTVERELGGGGMSRGFLAQEVRLGRTVVLKVLPPQMAAGVSVDRFEREIQLAAKLLVEDDHIGTRGAGALIACPR